jgi:Cys-rich protein (TIGR01571 family)
MVAHTSLDDSAVSRTKVTEHPLGEKEAATKPSQAYRSDIARGKRALLLFNDEADSLVSVNQQYDMRMKLTDEIDRISNHVGKLSSEKRVAEEKAAYEEYLVELRVELYKWVRSYEYGRQSLAVSSQNDSLLGGSLEIDGSTDMKTAHSFLSDKGSTVGSKVDHHESDKQKRSIPRQIKATDQFPDVRKQWKMVNVMAPYTLPEGFQFEARIRDEIFTATVPRGGVTQGEVFATRMGDVYGDTGNAAQRTRVFKDMDAPPSRWRDELFDCFHHGLDHHFLWNSLLCPHVALSQVMARIQISDTGEPQYTIRSRTRVWWYALFSFFLMAVHATFACFFIIAEPDDDALLMATCPLIGLDVSVILYFYYMLIKTRRIVRREYDIPELRCHGNEDCCLSVFCTCCTLSQMGRHTADYETYRSYCCTDTGMAKHIEVKLPSDFLDDIEEGNNSAASGGGPDFLNYTKDLH